MTSQIPRDSSQAFNSDDELWEAIARFHRGDSSPEEAARVQAHLAAHAADARLLELLSQSEEEADAPDVDVESALVAVRRRLIEVEATPRPTLTLVNATTGVRTQRTWRTALAAAAALAVVAFGVMQWRDYMATTGAGTEAVLLTTKAAQLDSLRLPDGSLVILGPSGQLTVADGYGTSHRNVRLTGWGYFDVVNSNASAPPFVVQTNAAHIQDIGTAFVVRTDSVDGVQVTVTNGLVRVTPQVGESIQPVNVSIGERLEIRAAQAPRLTHVDASAEAAWTQGQLVFRDTPLGDVARALSQWYGVRVEVDSALVQQSLVGELATDSLPQALQVLSLVFGATVQQDSGVVRLVPAERAPSR